MPKGFHSIPRISLSVYPIPPFFLALALPLFLSFLLLLPCIPQTSLKTSSLLGFSLYPSILSQSRYLTLFQLALLLRSPVQLYQNYDWQPLFWDVLYLILPFQLSHVCFGFEWVHSQIYS